jgi:hypothetical protein
VPTLVPAVSRTRVAHPIRFVRHALVPGAIQDPATKLWRLHRVGFILFFGRLVRDSFHAA